MNGVLQDMTGKAMYMICLFIMLPEYESKWSVIIL